MNDKSEPQTLDTYIREVKNQEIKGLLLKLKNEIRRSDVSSDTIESILSSVREKDENIATDIKSLLNIEAD